MTTLRVLLATPESVGPKELPLYREDIIPLYRDDITSFFERHGGVVESVSFDSNRNSFAEVFLKIPTHTHTEHTHNEHTHTTAQHTLENILNLDGKTWASASGLEFTLKVELYKHTPTRTNTHTHTHTH
eukprot:GHVR01142319.1.p1 GENE.GHVR01142319.1~~GHVR01142319.1.p1  ORF type:complete len:129 (-),score=69.56 GHVR01142319.1:43-429(-)